MKNMNDFCYAKEAITTNSATTITDNTFEHAVYNTSIVLGVSIHWTGLLDWNTGLDYWTGIFLVFTHILVS